MCKFYYAWKVLGILPVLKASAFTNQDEEWQRQRLLRLYHRSMDFVIADENDLCKEGRYFRFADKIVWARQAGFILFEILKTFARLLRTWASLSYPSGHFRWEEDQAAHPGTGLSYVISYMIYPFWI